MGTSWIRSNMRISAQYRRGHPRRSSPTSDRNDRKSVIGFTGIRSHDRTTELRTAPDVQPHEAT